MGKIDLADFAPNEEKDISLFEEVIASEVANPSSITLPASGLEKILQGYEYQKLIEQKKKSFLLFGDVLDLYLKKVQLTVDSFSQRFRLSKSLLIDVRTHSGSPLSLGIALIIKIGSELGVSPSDLRQSVSNSLRLFKSGSASQMLARHGSNDSMGHIAKIILEKNNVALSKDEESAIEKIDYE